MRKLITIIFLILLACPKEVIDYCRRLNVGIKISIIYLSLLLSTSVFGQLKKNTLSIAAGKANIESLITELEAAVQNEVYDEMKSLNEKIKNTMMEVGQKVYSQPESNPSDDVIETDFSTEK